MTDLTEKSKIKEGYYYAIVNGEQNIVKKVRGLKHPYCNGFCCDCYKYLSPVPSYDEWQAKLEENTELKEQINHLLKTQARQFVDNQKLQVKVEKAKDVVNIDTARQIKQLKELLKECREHLKYIVICPQNKKIVDKINQALGEDE